MGITTSSPLEVCITQALSRNAALYAFPSDLFYQIDAVKPYNLDRAVTPAAITWPTTNDQVASIIRCATEDDVNVQAKSGGHSYGNYGLGGENGSVVLDMKNFQHFSMNESTWQATIGAGMLLGDITDKLNAAGGRAIAHGTCPKVGIGGHATIGGLGPLSRQWGSSLDHIVEMEVVLANSTVTVASATENADLFFALKGAGASFGAITSFTFLTHPAPGSAVKYSFNFQFGDYVSMAQTFKAWRNFVAEPDLSWKFASQITITALGMIISGTYFGSQDNFDALGFDRIIHENGSHSVVTLDDWLGTVASWVDDGFQEMISGIPAWFYSKSLAFTPQTRITDSAVDALFDFLDKSDKGTPVWALIFDLEGGAINDVPANATAYGHRDALFYLQSYVANPFGRLSNASRTFIRGINDAVITAMPGIEFGAYAGYVDPDLSNPQQAYWTSNLARLQNIKYAVDPNDLFWNPQGVRPVAE